MMQHLLVFDKWVVFQPATTSKSLGYCIGLAEDQVVKDAQVGTLSFCWACFGGEELRHEFLASDFVFFQRPGLKHRF